jgi:threonine/homoserine/homoserine lactone efflux protein
MPSVESKLYLAFLAVSAAVIVVPGPSILLIVSTSLAAGRRAALWAVLGTDLAMALQLGVAGLATSSVVAYLSDWLAIVRWIGVLYLFYLGLRYWREAGRASAASSGGRRQDESAFVRGFLVSATNPTTMLFFVAFFPQFLSPTADVPAQLLLLGASFLSMAALVDVTYALLASGAAAALQDQRLARWRNRAAGTVMIAAALALGLARGAGLGP